MAGEAYFGMLGRQPESRTFDPRQPLVREGSADYALLQNGQRGLARRLREDGQVLAARSTHPSGHKGNAAGRQKRGPGLRAQGLAPRKCPGWRGQPAARQITAGDEDRAAGRAPIMELSDETYFYDPEGEWVVSSETTQYRNSRVHVETILRQRLRGLRRVSYQLPCFNSILECAFEDSGDNACVPRQLAQLLGVPFEEVCGDFDALAEHDWRAHGISPVEIRAFCARRNAPMVLISNTGEPLDRFEPAQRETKTVRSPTTTGTPSSTGTPGRCWMPPLEEWSPWQGEIKPGRSRSSRSSRA